jgi:colanic acid biosynthesis glycosyl transferase WcaI
MSLSGVRLGYICMYYWPEQSGSAPYVTEAAEHYAAQGAEVHVFTAMPHYPQWRVHEAYERRATLTETHGGVRIHRTRPYVPGTQSVLRRAAYEASWLLGQIPSSLAKPLDLVITSSPPLAALALGRAVAGRSRAPVGAVVQDFYGNAAAQAGIAGSEAVSGRVASVESFLLRQMDLVAVIDEGFVTTAVDAGVAQERVRCLPNWTHIGAPTQPRPAVRARLGWGSELVVLHTGNMGHKQGLDNVVSAARLAAEHSVPVRFVLMGDGNRRHALEEMAQGLSTMTFLEPVDDDLYPDVLQAADALLVNERPEAVEMSLPSKVTSYLATDRPIIAAVPDGLTRRYLSRFPGTRVVDAGQPEVLMRAVSEMASSDADEPIGSERTQAVAKDASLARYVAFAEELLGSRS